MDFTAPISYNGLTASGLTLASGGSPSVGIVFDRVDISPIDTEAYLDRRAVSDGADATDVYVGVRQVNINAAIYGSTIAHGYDQLQSVLRTFHPRIAFNADTANLGFLAFDFRQPTISTGVWTAGYIPLRLYLRPARPVSYVLDRQPTGGVPSKGVAFRAGILLVARDPRKYAQTASAVSVTTTAQTATNRGDYPTFPIFTWTMTAAGSSIHQIVVAGMAVKINLSAQSSGSFSFDYATRRLTKAGASMASLLDGAVDGFPEIEPGTVTTYETDNATGTSAYTMTYRDAFA